MSLKMGRAATGTSPWRGRRTSLRRHPEAQAPRFCGAGRAYTQATLRPTQAGRWDATLAPSGACSKTALVTRFIARGSEMKPPNTVSSGERVPRK